MDNVDSNVQSETEKNEPNKLNDSEKHDNDNSLKKSSNKNEGLIIRISKKLKNLRSVVSRNRYIRSYREMPFFPNISKDEKKKLMNKLGTVDTWLEELIVEKIDDIKDSKVDNDLLLLIIKIYLRIDEIENQNSDENNDNEVKILNKIIISMLTLEAFNELYTSIEKYTHDFDSYLIDDLNDYLNKLLKIFVADGFLLIICNYAELISDKYFELFKSDLKAIMLDPTATNIIDVLNIIKQKLLSTSSTTSTSISNSTSTSSSTQTSTDDKLIKEIDNYLQYFDTENDILIITELIHEIKFQIFDGKLIDSPTISGLKTLIFLILRDKCCEKTCYYIIQILDRSIHNGDRDVISNLAMYIRLDMHVQLKKYLYQLYFSQKSLIHLPGIAKDVIHHILCKQKYVFFKFRENLTSIESNPSIENIKIEFGNIQRKLSSDYDGLLKAKIKNYFKYLNATEKDKEIIDKIYANDGFRNNQSIIQESHELVHLILSKYEYFYKIDSIIRKYDYCINSGSMNYFKKLRYELLEKLLNSTVFPGPKNNILQYIIKNHFDEYKDELLLISRYKSNENIITVLQKISESKIELRNDIDKYIKYLRLSDIGCLTVDKLVNKVNHLKNQKNQENDSVIADINTVIEMILNKSKYSDVQIVYNRSVDHLDDELKSTFNKYSKTLLYDFGKPILIIEFFELFEKFKTEYQLEEHFSNKKENDNLKHVESELRIVLDKLPKTENQLSVKIEECLKYLKLNKRGQLILNNLYQFRNKINSEDEDDLNDAISSLLNQSSPIETEESLIKLKPFVGKSLSRLFNKYLESGYFLRKFKNETNKPLPERLKTIIKHLKQIENDKIKYVFEKLTSDPSTITIDESLKSLKKETLTDELQYLTDDYLNSIEHLKSLYRTKTKDLSDKDLKKLTKKLIIQFEEEYGFESDVKYLIKHCIELILSDQKHSEKLNSLLDEIRDNILDDAVDKYIHEYKRAKFFSMKN